MTAAFARLVATEPPRAAPTLFDTAYVLGGSVAGLLAARVLADHARQVVVLERDELDGDLRVGNGVPQSPHVHVLLPGGRWWIDRWLPGFMDDARRRGAVMSEPGQNHSYRNGVMRIPTTHHRLMMASRPLVESCVRAKVLGLPNVSVRRADVRGVTFTGGHVSAVDGVSVDFVVDATGRASKLSDWLGSAGYPTPPLRRVHSGVNYATTTFRRTEAPESLPANSSLTLFAPAAASGLTLAAINAVEQDRWLITLAGYDEARPGRTLEDFRAICASLRDPFPKAVSGESLSGIATYHQTDSRRRDFATLSDFPARLVSVGDAVTSFNPIYGQGMTSAALQAACLSEYLNSAPNLDKPATDFFARQEMVVDAAWSISAGGDIARQEAGADLPEEVRRQRWESGQIIAATAVDPVVAAAFEDVAYMVVHPEALADRALIERAIAANAA
jgi:2-polyprenyl-6-methoxyphenol hydroxylase-like FAD-dependent oxidoreductase